MASYTRVHFITEIVLMLLSQVLLFCTMTTMLDMIEQLLEWRGLLDEDQVLRLDGSTAAADRGELLEHWNETGAWK